MTSARLAWLALWLGGSDQWLSHHHPSSIRHPTVLDRLTLPAPYSRKSKIVILIQECRNGHSSTLDSDASPNAAWAHRGNDSLLPRSARIVMTVILLPPAPGRAQVPDRSGSGGQRHRGRRCCCCCKGGDPDKAAAELKKYYVRVSGGVASVAAVMLHSHVMSAWPGAAGRVHACRQPAVPWKAGRRRTDGAGDGAGQRRGRVPGFRQVGGATSCSGG